MDKQRELEQSISGLLGDAVKGCKASQSVVFSHFQHYFRIVAEQTLDQNLRSRVSPSDVIQQSYLKATTQMHQFAGATEKEVRAWLQAIVVNEARQYRREHLRGTRDVRREVSPIVNEDSRNKGLEFASNSITPQSRAIAIEELARLKSNLAELPEDYRKVIQLRSLERKSFQDIGEIMNRSEAAVSKLWYRAVLALKKEMSKDSNNGR